MTSDRRNDSAARAAALTVDTGAAPAPPSGIEDTLDSPAAPPPPPSPTALDPAARIGRYVLLSKLGEGGMGEVYSAYDEELDRRIALKVVHARHAHDRRSWTRMEREAVALARLSHPNVVQIHDVGQHHGQVFVAMEYMPGETLRVAQERHDPTTSVGRRAILDLYLQAGRGLAAAHAVGLVHRDFKPENVMVGADGRVRVFDFGLAVAEPAAAPRQERVMVRTGPRALDLDLTRAGAVMGTPSYMAPEQFLARPTDHRTDIFAFSVALYLALYRELPFDGDDLDTRKAAVVAGVPRPAPAGASVPPWLRAVLLRGLAREPADRHASMEALLAALADDPDERGRQRRRRVGLALAAVTAAWLIGVAGLWGWERWQHHRAERQAGERLAAMEARLDALLAAGAVADAERVFLDFVGHPDNRVSAAHGRAWLDRAERARGRGDGAAAIDALASAYTVATASADQDAALAGLAGIFRDEMRWPALNLALETATQRPGDALDPADVLVLRLDAALGRRDLPGAVALLRGPLLGTRSAAALPVLTALGAATETGVRHRGYAVVVDLDGDLRPELVLETNARDRQLAQVVRADLRLTPVATVDLGWGTFRALSPGPGRPGLLVSRDVAAGSAVVSRLAGDRLVEVFRWPDEQIRAALGADVDGDGAHELLVGTGPYTRHLVELVHGTDQGWSARAPAPDVDRRRSDVVDLFADDLDGDGRLEVVAALGPWDAYEVLVLRHDPAGDVLRTVARRRLGNIAGVAPVRGGAGPEIAVSKTDEYPSKVVFPHDSPFGEPAGTYFFRLEGGDLVATGFTPAPRLAEGERVLDGPPIVGDLDGDGRDEVVFCRTVGDARSSAERDNTVILVRAGDGAPTSIVLGDVRPIAALDLDGDRDDELLVSRSDDGDRVWVLGSGAATLPPVASDLAPAAAPLASPDPVLGRMLRRADDLARMGLVGQSADNLARLAGFVGEPGLRAQAELRAAELYASIAADHRAAELFARAAEALAPAAGARAAATRALVRLARVDEAATQLERARDEAVAPAEDLVAAIAALHRGPGVELRFARPLASTWRIGQPIALRRDGAREALHVDALVAGELLSAPIRWTGESLALEVDLDLDRIEWGSGLEIGLVRDGSGLADATSPLGVDVATTGGGDVLTHEIGCAHHGRRNVARIPVRDPLARPGRFTIRATLLPGLGELTCEVVRGDGQVLLYRRVPLADDSVLAPLRLTLAAARAPWARVEAEVRRIRLRGAELDDPRDEDVEPALLDARRGLVEDDALDALAALRRATAPTPGDRLLEVVALARLARLGEAERALAGLLADPAAAHAVGPQLDARLRVTPEIFGPLLRAAAGPTTARARLAAVWTSAIMHDRDPRALAVIWAGLAERDLDADGYDVLRLHARAAAALGHHDAAEASFRASLRALADPGRLSAESSAAWVETERAAVHLELAALALARGDEEAARHELRPLLARPGGDPYIEARLRARDELRPLRPLLRE